MHSHASTVRSWEDILLVDDFTTPQSVSATGYHFTWTAASGDGILGTDRMLDVVALESGLTADCDVSDGTLVISSPETGFSVGVTWMGENSDGLSVDMSEGVGIRVHAKTEDPISFVIDICSGSGGPECGQQTVYSRGGGDYENLFFAFSKFTSIDFTNVNEIDLTITSSLPRGDILIDSVTVVAPIVAITDVSAVVDDFFTSLPRAELEITSDPSPESPAVLARNSDAPAILGGERNQALVVTDPGYAGHTGTLAMEVTDGALATDFSIFGGYLLLQYDGEDGVTSLDGPNLLVGLGGFDGTVNGQSAALKVSLGGQRFYHTPYTASLSVFVYDTDERVAVVEGVEVAPLEEVLGFWIPLSDFNGVELTSIAAIELMLNLRSSSSDIYVTDISFVGVGGGTGGCAAAAPVGDGHVVLSNVGGLVYENLCGLGTQSGIVWLSYLANNSGSLYISTCDENTAIDTVVAVISDCHSLGCIVVNDDAPCNIPGGTTSSSISVNVNQGQVYYIAVGGYGTAEGPIGLELAFFLQIGVIES